MSESPPTLVWFRQDLRLSDNPALLAAIDRGAPIIPIFIWAPHEEGNWSPGAASKWWLHQSLKSLCEDLAQLKGKLIIRQGGTFETIKSLVAQTQAKAIFWNRRYEPAIIDRDDTIQKQLRQLSLTAESFNSNLLSEPWQILNSQGKPFQVFSAYWKAFCKEDFLSAPSAEIKYLICPGKWPDSLSLDDLELEPKIDWAAGLRATWRPGEAGAQKQLTDFAWKAMLSYSTGRNRPAWHGVSYLSPHIHFGEVSPRQVYHRVEKALNDLPAHFRPSARRQVGAFFRELGWREFAYYLLFHFPQTTDLPMKSEFHQFPWIDDKALLRVWQKGKTGYPIVDAGMRQLWQTGWMHNRARMIVASFLVKDLLINWLKGAKWFFDTLVDADLANNTLGWQWTAGSGVDAAPYFRIFNPVNQGKKFDPQGEYVRQWLPELAELPDNIIHAPWLADKRDLADAGVELGKTYPWPVVDHMRARERALAALNSMKEDRTRPVIS
jgi:deoxyribodipyrimidine photo-lyase